MHLVMIPVLKQRGAASGMPSPALSYKQELAQAKFKMVKTILVSTYILCILAYLNQMGRAIIVSAFPFLPSELDLGSTVIISTKDLAAIPYF